MCVRECNTAIALVIVMKKTKHIKREKTDIKDSSSNDSRGGDGGGGGDSDGGDSNSKCSNQKKNANKN